MRLSDHFTLEEMTRSQTAARRRIDNTPSPEIVENLVVLCNEILEPLRAEFGPIWISSGYRSPELNRAIGGSKTSVHPLGKAADHVTHGLSLEDEMAWWIDHDDIPWDQAILEYGGWIHIGAARPCTEPRHQALRIAEGTGYELYRPGHACPI